MRFILGKKLGMTQVFREDGTIVPVTRVQAGPCTVTQVKTREKDGINSVQVGFGEQKKFRIKKPGQGHLKDIATVRFMRDFAIEENHELGRGDVFTVKIFQPGEKVQVVGRSKGKGFQGVVKRHGFHGSPASHGHKDQLRMPGSIGATDPARVFKGKRMPGHMGDAQVTVKNLEIVEIDPEENELLIKGAIPGARGGLLLISTDEGKIEIASPEQEEKEIGNLKLETGEEEKAKDEAKEEKPVEKAKEEIKDIKDTKDKAVEEENDKNEIETKIEDSKEKIEDIQDNEKEKK